MDASILGTEELKQICITLCESKKLDVSSLPDSRDDLIIFYNRNTKRIDYNKMKVPQLKEECRKYNLKLGGKKQDLIERLNEYHGVSKEEVKATKNIGLLSLLAKKDLERICKQLQIQHTGKKDELVSRIEQSEKEGKDEILKNTPVPIKKRKPRKDQINKYHEKTKDLIKRLNKICKKQGFRLVPKKLKIKYNDAIGSYHDEDTGFVFDSVEKKVTSVYKNGKLQSLSDNDIELCKELHISWVTPEIIIDEEDEKHNKSNKSNNNTDKKEKSEEIYEDDLEDDIEDDDLDDDDDEGDDDDEFVEE